MESNQFTQQGEQRSAIRVSGKLFNDDDGLIWPTEGRFAALAGQTKAGNMPGQQTRQTGQMTPYRLKLL
jgi:hypothetical protein